jgi:protein ImuB
MFATVLLPNFYLQAAWRHRQPKTLPNDICQPSPVALIDQEEAKPGIRQLNEHAQAAGVRQGMTPSQGLARCPGLCITSRSLVQEKVLQEILLQQAFTLSPLVEATAPGVCTVQFTDTRNLPEKVSRALTRLAAMAVNAQAGLAPAPDPSFLAAHLARPFLQIDDAREFLAPLPLEILAINLD